MLHPLLKKILIPTPPEKGAVKILHVLSGWLATSYLIRRAFLQHISLTVSVESVINKRKSSCHFACMKEWLDWYMDVCSSYKHGSIILDLKGFLINQKLFPFIAFHIFPHQLQEEKKSLSARKFHQEENGSKLSKC